MLKRFVPLRGPAGNPQPRMVVGFSFVLLALLGSSFVLSSFITKHQAAHAANATQAARPALNSGVSKTWYLAEGRVGGGFREFITIGNPDPTTDCSATITYMPEGEISAAQAKQHQAARKPLDVKTISIPHASRYTASVNQDLGVDQQQQPGIQVSAVVSVPFSSGCTGVVVERPMYFNYNGVNSGSDVMGTTSLGENFYFADVPTMAGASSFMKSSFSVLNPSLTDTATITLLFYAKGSLVRGQYLYIAPGARGTIDPGTLPYPHVAARIESNITVAVERFSYMHNVSAESAGTVSSAASVVGAQSLSNDWLFAEGYTGGQSQENLLLSNLTDTDTTATVTLEYQNTHHQTLTVPVPKYSEVPVDVNSVNTQPTGTCDVIPCVTTSEVSAEVTATSVSLVVERQMFFHYTHTIPGTSISTATTGGTEVQGTLQAAVSTANFAEGYTNVGYNEWLTLQNPMASDETLALYISNENGRVYTQNLLVKAKSRSTVDVTALVLQHLVQKGDNYKGYQVSMHVQTTAPNTVFVAERPMYFNLSANIQGGTDVIGFTGAYSCTELNTNLTHGDDIDFMTTGPDGNIWAAEYYYNNNSSSYIAKITPSGATTEYAIPTANAEAEGITAGPDGNVWFTEYSGNKIGKITPAGVITEYPLPTDSSGPEGIALGSDGNLWFGEVHHDTVNSTYIGTVGKITPAGVITEYPLPSSSNGNVFYGVQAGTDGNVWFIEDQSKKIGKITPAGVITEYPSASNSNDLDDIAPGSDGNMWYTLYNSNEIAKITPSGVTTVYSQGLTPNSGPYMISKGPDGNVWFTEDDSDKIGVITPTGTITELKVMADNPDPAGITLGPDNNIWFSDYETGQIGRCSISY